MRKIIMATLLFTIFSTIFAVSDTILDITWCVGGPAEPTVCDWQVVDGSISEFNYPGALYEIHEDLQVTSVTWAEINNEMGTWVVPVVVVFTYNEGYPGDAVPSPYLLTGGAAQGSSVSYDAQIWAEQAEPGDMYVNWQGTWSVTKDGNVMVTETKVDGSLNTRVWKIEGDLWIQIA